MAKVGGATRSRKVSLERLTKEDRLDIATAECRLDEHDIAVLVEECELDDDELPGVLEETMGGIEENYAEIKDEVLIMKTQFFGANGEGGFCQQMQDGMKAQTDAILALRTDQETHQAILRAEMVKINEKQDIELAGMRALITDIESRQKLMDERLKIVENYYRARSGMWWKVAIAFVGGGGINGALGWIFHKPEGALIGFLMQHAPAGILKG